MNAVIARFRAQRRMTLALVLLLALAVAFLPFRRLMAASSTADGQGGATPTATAAGHAAMDESSANAAGASHVEMQMPMSHGDAEMPGMSTAMEATGHADATPAPAEAGAHADMDESSMHAAGASHAEEPVSHDDAHAPALPLAGESSSHASSEGHGEQMTSADAHTETGHIEAAEAEPAAHGHGSESPSVASSTRGLVLSGFGAANSLIILGAAVLKTRAAIKSKARRVSPPETTTRGASQ